LLWILFAIGVSACGGVETDVSQAAADAQIGMADTVATPQCQLARDLGYSEADVLSCLEGTPVKTNDSSESSKTPTSNPKGTVTAQACNTYYGRCTSWYGCSKAEGEGWAHTSCGSWHYAWLTVCNGEATGWGEGLCAW
jgi:hypothetical protein